MGVVTVRSDAKTTSSRLQAVVRHMPTRTVYVVSHLKPRSFVELMGIQRSVARYRRVGNDTPELRERLCSLAAERRRFGYRRLWVLLRQEGFGVNRKRVYRLYREEGLSVRRRQRKRRPASLESPRRHWSAQTSDGRWTLCPTPSPMAGGSEC